MSRVDQILSLAGLPNSSNSTSGCDNTKLKSAVLNSNQAQLFGNSQRERVEIEMWLTFSAKTMNTDMLKALNNTLLYKTYLVRSSVSIADFAVFHSVSSLKYDDLSNLTRWIGNMTNHICLKTSVSASISSNTFIPIPVMDSETTATPASAPTTAAPVAGLSAAVKNATVDSKTGKDAPAKEIAEASGASLDPSKLEIRCGLVVKCWNHPDSDKLLCEEIDVGNGEIRTIASGLRAFYTADQLQGRKVAVLANLKERSMAGFKSQGMVLCAVSKDHSVVRLLEVPESAAVGEKVVFKGFPADSVPATPAQMAKKKILEGLAPGLRTDSQGVAHWDQSAFTIGGGVVKATGVCDAVVS